MEAAKTLRDDFVKLYDTINDSNFDGNLTRADFARLLVGALIIVNQLHDRAEALKKAIAGYQTDVISKLQDIMDNTKTDEEAMAMAEEKFSIKEEG